MKYGYVRIIAKGQMIEDQVQELLDAGVDIIHKEKDTVEATHRPVFEKLLNTLRPQDILVVTKFSGFARNTHEALEVMQLLVDRKVAINILDVGLVDETPTGKLIFTVFSAFAQFEREIIRTRTQEGKKYAREHNPNYREGRKRIYSDARIENAYKLKAHGKTFREISKISGISVATLKRRFAMLHLNNKRSKP